MADQWCDWQVKAMEDVGEPDSWTCAAHLNEGRAFQCPYKNMDDAKNRQYQCVDAEPVKED